MGRTPIVWRTANRPFLSCSRRCASAARPDRSPTELAVRRARGCSPTARRGYRASIDEGLSGHEADDRPAPVCRSSEARQRFAVVPRPCNEDATGNVSVREVPCVRSHCAASIGPLGYRHSGLWRNLDCLRRARRCGLSAPSFGVAPTSTLGASCSQRAPFPTAVEPARWKGRRGSRSSRA